MVALDKILGVIRGWGGSLQETPEFFSWPWSQACGGGGSILLCPPQMASQVGSSSAPPRLSPAWASPSFCLRLLQPQWAGPGLYVANSPVNLATSCTSLSFYRDVWSPHLGSHHTCHQEHWHRLSDDSLPSGFAGGPLQCGCMDIPCPGELAGAEGALPWCSQGAPWEAQVARALSPGDCESVFRHLLRDGPQASGSLGQGEGLSQVPNVFTSPSP